MNLKNKMKKLLVLILAAGITINSIPLSSYATTISGQDSGLSAVVKENQTSPEEGTAEETQADTEESVTEESQTGTEESTVEESRTDTEESTVEESQTDTEENTAEESLTDTEEDTVEEPQTGTEETETEEETVFMEETMDVSLEEQVRMQVQEAKKALQELLGTENVMALVYLCDFYEVKSEADFLSETTASLPSGHTVLIQDVEAEAKTGTIWYRILFEKDNKEYSGYIPREYLAYSNEKFIAWEELYIEAVQQLFSENGNKIATITNDGAVNTYSSDISQFPSSYQSALQTLKNKHKNWTFVKHNTGLNWDDVVYGQLNPKVRSLISKSRPAAWKNGDYDSAWAYASEAALKYYLDPRNGFTESRIFQFEQLTFNASYHNVSAIQSVLNSSFMSGMVPKESPGVSYAQAFYNIGRARGISPFHLASRVIQEQGRAGTSPLISGTYKGYEGYYNYFNIGATSANPIIDGLKYAKNAGWNTPYKSMDGGSKTIGTNYILKGQDTLYLQKFNVYNGDYGHQYMQNIEAPKSEASTTRSLYNQSGSIEGTFVFKIPVFNNMPAVASPEPTSEAITLSAGSKELKGGNAFTVNYTINNKNSSLSACTADKTGIVSIVKGNETKDNTNNKVTGSVTITAVSPGTTYVRFTSSGGATATCKITVVKDTVTLKPAKLSLFAGNTDGTIPGETTEIAYEINNAKSSVKNVTVKNSDSGSTARIAAEKKTEEVDSKNNKITGTIRVTGLNPGKATVTVTSKYGGSGTAAVTVIRLPEKVTMDTRTLTISTGNSKTARATVLPEDTSNKNLIWTSSNEDVAIVNKSTGRVTAIGSGTAVITATAEEKSLKEEILSDTCTVTVVPAVESVEIAAEETELLVTETFALNGKFYPEAAVDSGIYSIVYKSLDTEIAEVDANGVITAKALGNTVITATVYDKNCTSSTKTVSCKVTVVPERKEETILPEYGYIQPEKIQIYKAGTEEQITDSIENLKTGGVTALSYKIFPEDAVVENVTWESSKPSVAKVTENEDGTVTVLAGTKGNAVITVKTDIGIKKQLNVTVEEKQIIETVTLDKTELILYSNGANTENPGKTPSEAQLTAAPEQAEENGIVYNWSSTNEETAVVDSTGKVKAKAPGKAVIIAEDAGGSGKFAKCTVTVESCLEKIETNVDKLWMQPGKKVTVKTGLEPLDATSRSLLWESSNEKAATVNETGVVTVPATAQTGWETLLTVTDEITGLSRTIPLTVTEEACKSVTIFEGETKAEPKTLYANGREEEQNYFVSAVGYNAQKAAMEPLSFYAASSNEKVAQVEKTADGKFKITAKAKGSATIKISAADGSNVSASVKVTVKVRPESVTMQKEALYLLPKGSATMTASVTPLAANNKSVTWQFTEDMTEQEKAAFTLNSATGKVTVKQGTPEGVQGRFVAVTKDGGVIAEQSCTVTVVSKKVSKIKLDTSSLIMTQLGAEKQLAATVTPADATVTALKFTSSDESVATIDGTGRIKAVGYGLTTITAQTLDNSKKVTCKVYVTSIEKAYKISAVASKCNIQNYRADINSSYTLQIKDQFGNILDHALFTFTSNKPDMVQVDEKGVVTPNKAFEPSKNEKATITAALTGDPYGRKVRFTVTVLAKEQTESVSVKVGYMLGGEEKIRMNPESFAVKFPTDEISLTAAAQNAYGEETDTKLKWSVSDTSVAGIKEDKDTKTAVLTIKKAGKFYITCTADDTLKKSRTIQITAINAEPVLVKNKTTVNKETEPDENGYVWAEALQFVENKNSPIQEMLVGEVRRGKEEINKSSFRVQETGNGYWAIGIGQDANLDTGAYRVTLQVKTLQLPELGLTGDDTGMLIHEIPVTLNITNQKAKVTVKASAMNRQNIAQLESLLTITASGKIESIKTVKNQSNKFDVHFEEPVEKENGIWSLALKENSDYKANSIAGKLSVKVKGFATPVIVNVKISTPLKKDAVAVKEIPSINVEQIEERKEAGVDVTLYNKVTKENLDLREYDIVAPDNAKLDMKANSKGTLTVMPKKDVKYSNGATVTVGIQLKKRAEDGTKLWKEYVKVNISVKTFTQKPAVTLGSQSLTLNKRAESETAETTIKTNRTNVKIADEGEWQISLYDSKTKKYTVIKEIGETAEEAKGDVILSYNRQSGMLSAALRDGSTVKTGNYKYRITWIVEDYYTISKDITIHVVDRAVSAKITAKGKLDLLTRSDATMQAAISLTNTKGKVKSITMMELDENGNYQRNSYFYSAWLNDNSFKIKLREKAEMTAGRKKVPVKIVLEGGTVLYADVSFTVSQSTPKVTIPKAETIYKSGSGATVMYDMNTKIPSGYEISMIKTVSAPAGIGVTIENGRVSVSLADRSIKPGTYSIKINMYFKGAQYVFGSDYGKAFQKTLKVTVKE